jgi:FKBP-type peptidyl-prolyl cis-trans isomerase
MKRLSLFMLALILIASCSEDPISLINLEEGEAFLTKNANEEGVNRIEQGLQYSIIETGNANSMTPSLENTITAHFHGTLINGDVFWSSVDLNEPLTIKLSQLIVGCQKVISLMKTGDKWRVFIHPSLAYGLEGRPSIPPNAVLIFDIELLEVI